MENAATFVMTQNSELGFVLFCHLELLITAFVFSFKFYFHDVAGDMLGTVTVVVMTPNKDEEVGRTQFTYLDKLDEAFQTILTDKELQCSFFKYMEEGKKGSGKGITANSESLDEGIRNSTFVDDTIRKKRWVFVLGCVSQYSRKHFGSEKVFYVHYVTYVHHRNPILILEAKY